MASNANVLFLLHGFQHILGNAKKVRCCISSLSFSKCLRQLVKILEFKCIVRHRIGGAENIYIGYLTLKLYFFHCRTTIQETRVLSSAKI